MQNGVGSVCLHYGKHYIMNTNSSKNQCFYSAMAESIGGNSTFISRCSFVDNVIIEIHSILCRNSKIIIDNRKNEKEL